MSDAVVSSGNPLRAAKAMKIIAKKAGIYGMVGGQVVDVINDNKEKSLETIDYINNLKNKRL